jgi:hypothetical protein
VLAAWLRANGFTDFFIDHQQIAGGDKWPEALRASAGSCRVVVCLVTPNWLASSECFAEFEAAWYMGKRIIPLFLLPPSTSLDADAKTRLDRVSYPSFARCRPWLPVRTPDRYDSPSRCQVFHDLISIEVGSAKTFVPPNGPPLSFKKS